MPDQPSQIINIQSLRNMTGADTYVSRPSQVHVMSDPMDLSDISYIYI